MQGERWSRNDHEVMMPQIQAEHVYTTHVYTFKVLKDSNLSAGRWSATALLAHVFGLPSTFRIGSAALLVFLFSSLFGAACLLPVRAACTMTEETIRRWWADVNDTSKRFDQTAAATPVLISAQASKCHSRSGADIHASLSKLPQHVFIKQLVPASCSTPKLGRSSKSLVPLNSKICSDVQVFPKDTIIYNNYQ